MSHLLLVGRTHLCKQTLGNDCAVRPSVTIRLDTSQVGKRDSARVPVVVVVVRRNGRTEVFVDRKYGHRGYRDAEKQDKKDKSRDRQPPAPRSLLAPRATPTPAKPSKIYSRSNRWRP